MPGTIKRNWWTAGGPAALFALVVFALSGCLPTVANEVLDDPILGTPIAGEFINFAVNGSAQAGDFFGISTAISGVYAVAGAPPKDVGGVTSGGAYVYRQSSGGWGEEFELGIPGGFTPEPGDDFGRSVSISGNYLIVGATSKDSGQGAAYVFERTGTNTWGNATQLQDAGSPGGNYGQTVAIDGDHAIVASANEDAGRVYVYERVGPGNIWNLLQVLVGSDSNPGDQFGRSIGISGPAVIVGAYINSNGKAYVFRFNGAIFEEEAQLISTDFTSADNYGSQVAIGGNYAAVTARNHNGYGSDRGAVYFYRYSGGAWSSPYKTIPAVVENGGQFGTSVRISGNNAIVSAFLECGIVCAPGVVPSQGALYALRRSGDNTWDVTQRIVAPDAATTDSLGFGIGLSEAQIVAGAAFADPGGLSNAGKIYFFR